MSTYPCYIPPETPAYTFDALTSSLGIFYETLMHHATRSGSPHNALHSPSIIYIYEKSTVQLPSAGLAQARPNYAWRRAPASRYIVAFLMNTPSCDRIFMPN